MSGQWGPLYGIAELSPKMRLMGGLLAQGILALQRRGNNQHELLRVLDKPYLPLHNNLSERDIRDDVKKRKISGSTRSEAVS